MPRYKVDLVARLIGFHTVQVEAANVEEAREQAIADAKKLPHYEFDVQDVEHYGDDNSTPDIEVNEIEELVS